MNYLIPSDIDIFGRNVLQYSTRLQVQQSMVVTVQFEQHKAGLIAGDRLAEHQFTAELILIYPLDDTCTKYTG